jgi:two-component sensor histidine kinase
MLIVDRAGTCLFANKAAKALNADALLEDNIYREESATALFSINGLPYPFRSFPLSRALLFGVTTQESFWRIEARDGRSVLAVGRAAPLNGPNGQQIGAVLMFRDASDQLRREAELGAAIAMKDMLVKEIHHRVKNNLQLVSSLLNLQAHQAADHNTSAALSDVSSRINIIADIHRVLYDGGETNVIDVVAYLQRLADGSLAPFAESFDSSLQTSAQGQFDLQIEKATSLALAVNELFINALKQAATQQRTCDIFLSITATDKQLHISFAADYTNTGTSGSEAVDRTRMNRILVDGLRKQLAAKIDRRISTFGHEVRITVPVKANQSLPSP